MSTNDLKILTNDLKYQIMTKTSKKLLKQHLKIFFTNLTKLQLSFDKFQRFLAGVLELDLIAVQLDQHPGNRQRLVKLSFKPSGPLELL